MSHSLTIRQFAALAEVSQATVSMAFHNHPRISPATRDRIWKLAKAHGYTPGEYRQAYETANRDRAQTMGILFDWRTVK